MLNEHDDRNLREYAKRLHPQLGEDAYHNVVCDVLVQQKVIHNIEPFFHVAMKRALWKIYRHEQSEREQIEAYIQGDPSPSMKGLLIGRETQNIRQAQCRRGHELVEGNLAYISGRRTCRTCKRMRERVGKGVL